MSLLLQYLNSSRFHPSLKLPRNSSHLENLCIICIDRGPLAWKRKRRPSASCLRDWLRAVTRGGLKIQKLVELRTWTLRRLKGSTGKHKAIDRRRRLIVGCQSESSTSALSQACLRHEKYPYHANLNQLFGPYISFAPLSVPMSGLRRL